jgi:hypothetical protein
MVGSATLTTLTSRMTMNCATATSARMAFGSTREVGRGTEAAAASVIRI